MTRGKYKARAEKRTDMQAVEDENAKLLLQIRNLENDKAVIQSKLDQKAQWSKAEIARLQREIAEGTSEKVRALEYKYDLLMGRNKKLDAAEKMIVKSHNALLIRAMKVITGMGMSDHEAVAALKAAPIGETPGDFINGREKTLG